MLKSLKDNKFFLRTVSVNLTYVFQRLIVQGGPNYYGKRYMKNKFYEWYSTQVTQALDRDKEIDEIEVPLKLSLPLGAKGFIEMYSHMTEEGGRKVCMKGWEVAGIKEAV